MIIEKRWTRDNRHYTYNSSEPFKFHLKDEITLTPNRRWITKTKDGRSYDAFALMGGSLMTLIENLGSVGMTKSSRCYTRRNCLFNGTHCQS